MASNTDWEDVLDCITPSITDEKNMELLMPISKKEVKDALFQMNPDKSPGPDGMTPEFYQNFWSIVGSDAMQQVIANRLKLVLGHVISDTQSAFIPRRLISDNFMVSFEVMHYLKQKRKGKKGYMDLKLDMSKACDRIEWAYLRAILGKMGFTRRWVDMVLSCVATGFSTLINKYERRGRLKWCKVARGAPVVSQMLFADDSYLYCQATEGEVRNVLELLDSCEKASGQKINLDKSSVFFSTNSYQNSKNQICSVLGIAEVEVGSTYLGLPNMMGRNKSTILGFLKDRIQK
ncbi:uncharacterized protein LOC133779006 [Humulus lupulus]|uniref:uncharacterized protein LOC133779006 n=1 Tax=Humulus lupulus TaxID=3486 RepID=UPI002B4065E5|nr:uncharacterized protein LOC133779006 [Humulus lupulus]